METLFQPVDLYCERLTAGLWAEPLNALSNLAFVAAGLYGLREARRRRAGRFVALLCCWVVLIGVGSGLFHTFANRLTALADTLPIAAFTLAYVVFTLRRMLDLSWLAAAIGATAFVAAAGLLAAALPHGLAAATNGSTAYLPALLALFFFGGLMTLRRKPAGPWNLAAGVVFGVSLSFRIADPRVCAELPIGTHFVWHILNGLMLGVLLAAAARFGAPPGGSLR